MSHFQIQPGIAHNEAQPWLASLPTPLSMRSLKQLTPGIADRIAAAWNDVFQTSQLLEELLVGEEAAELPSAVAGELLRLYEFHARCRVNDAPDTTWELPVSRLDTLATEAACGRN